MVSRCFVRLAFFCAMASLTPPDTTTTREWCANRLSFLLGFEANDLVESILSFRQRSELEDYLKVCLKLCDLIVYPCSLSKGLLNSSDPAHLQFISELCSRLFKVTA